MDNQLLSYLDGSILKDYEEIQEILRVEQTEEDELWKELDRLLAESRIQTAEKEGLERWETILELKPADTDSFDVRRLRIKGKLNETLPYSYRVTCAMLCALCGRDGVEVSQDIENYTFSANVELKSKKLKSEVEKLLDRVIPENMILKVTLKYNTHRILSQKTHRELSAFTHRQLREEEMEA